MMKTKRLLFVTIILSTLALQDVNGGNNVSKKKLQKWDQTIKDMDRGSNFENIDLKTNQKLPEKGDLQDLLEVIQYVITDAFNNKEFRQFMIKRFLHNYVPQASSILTSIKKLKKEINPKSVREDDKKDDAMKNKELM